VSGAHTTSTALSHVSAPPQGNLSAFVEKKPEAKTYYDLQESTVCFKFPEPGFLEGIKSKDRAILKMHRVGFRYAGWGGPAAATSLLWLPVLRAPAKCICQLMSGGSKPHKQACKCVKPPAFRKHCPGC